MTSPVAPTSSTVANFAGEKEDALLAGSRYAHAQLCSSPVMCDAMGLRKTIQGIVFALSAARLPLFGGKHTLILASRGLLDQWLSTWVNIVKYKGESWGVYDNTVSHSGGSRHGCEPTTQCSHARQAHREQGQGKGVRGRTVKLPAMRSPDAQKTPEELIDDISARVNELWAKGATDRQATTLLQHSRKHFGPDE